MTDGTPDLRGPSPLAPGVWHVEGRLRLSPGIHFPVRSTLVDTGEGLALVSPLGFDDETAARIDALGAVTFLVAPNLFHHLFLEAATARWPEAKVLAPPGLRSKRPGLTIDGDPSSLPGVEVHRVAGMPKLEEHALFHRPSGTLVVTDLVFNMHRAHTGLTRFILKYVSRAYGRVAVSGLLRWLTKDRPAAAASLDAILALPFERLVMAHGDVVEEDARAQLAAATLALRGKPAAPALLA